MNFHFSLSSGWETTKEQKDDCGEDKVGSFWLRPRGACSLLVSGPWVGRQREDRFPNLPMALVPRFALWSSQSWSHRALNGGQREGARSKSQLPRELELEGPGDFCDTSWYRLHALFQSNSGNHELNTLNGVKSLGQSWLPGFCSYSQPGSHSSS